MSFLYVRINVSNKSERNTLLKIQKFLAGEKNSDGYIAISEMLTDFKPESLATDMMRYRISGKASAECNDIYYVATENGEGIARHWMGWGKHADAIGNWGNFYTNEEFRGKGVGRALLTAWYEDFLSRESLPIALLCTAANTGLVEVYSRYGFRSALKDGDPCPLYMPIGDSPKDFLSFCEFYYTPADLIIKRPASIEWRHEIDCLFKFYLLDNKMEFGINGVSSLEEALLRYPERAELFFTDSNRCVGWAIDGKAQLHSLYKNSKVISD